MMGHSWGGFNALQVAARRPPALRAIITSCSTDDRYADDIHYMGGALLLDNLRWASTMFAHNSRPPDPAVVGERWRAMWLERLRGSGLWIDTWLRHPRRDAFWQQGSVCEDFTAIRCAVLAVGGWLDAYSNAIPRLLAGLPGPRRGLIGQWAHRYPHMALPGPAIGFLQLALDWWDRWLKGTEPRHGDEPLLRAFIQDSVPPAGWPSARGRRRASPRGGTSSTRRASRPTPGPRYR
jgi:predicted acyl esterase